MTKIFIIAGEDSGDQLGAALIPALQKIFPDVELRGIGGPAMLGAGLPESLFPMDKLSVMGIAEILPRIPKFLRLIAQTVQAATVFDPDFVITIDAPDFSFRVQKQLKQKNVRAQKIHYVAPTVWAWRAGRAQKVAQFLDGMICLFPFEPIYFEKEGLKSCFAGHPVMQSPVFAGDGAAFRAQHGLTATDKVLGLFCGSRRSELDVSVPLLKDIAQTLCAAGRQMSIVIPTLPKWHSFLEDSFKSLPCKVIVSSEPAEKWNAFRSADIAIAVSGTVALEIALAGIPHVILYKMNKWTWEIIKRVSKTKFAHLGNILLGHLLYPEFIQDNACTEKIVPVLESLFDSPIEQKIQKEGSKNIQLILAPNPNENAADRAAAFIKSFSLA